MGAQQRLGLEVADLDAVLDEQSDFLERRLHSTLSYISPMQFERAWLATQEIAPHIQAASCSLRAVRAAESLADQANCWVGEPVGCTVGMLKSRPIRVRAKK